MTAPSDTLTVAQAAEALGVSERTVWRYLKSGRLPGETVGEPGAQRTLIPDRGRRGPARRARAAPTPRPCGPSATGWPPSWPPPGPSATPCAGACACCSARCRRPLRPGIAERALSRALEVAARARGPRVSVR